MGKIGEFVKENKYEIITVGAMCGLAWCCTKIGLSYGYQLGKLDGMVDGVNTTVHIVTKTLQEVVDPDNIIEVTDF